MHKIKKHSIGMWTAKCEICGHESSTTGAKRLKELQEKPLICCGEPMIHKQIPNEEIFRDLRARYGAQF